MRWGYHRVVFSRQEGYANANIHLLRSSQAQGGAVRISGGAGAGGPFRSKRSSSLNHPPQSNRLTPLSSSSSACVSCPSLRHLTFLFVQRVRILGLLLYSYLARPHPSRPCRVCSRTPTLRHPTLLLHAGFAPVLLQTPRETSCL